MARRLHTAWQDERARDNPPPLDPRAADRASVRGQSVLSLSSRGPAPSGQGHVPTEREVAGAARGAHAKASWVWAAGKLPLASAGPAWPRAARRNHPWPRPNSREAPPLRQVGATRTEPSPPVATRQPPAAAAKPKRAAVHRPMTQERPLRPSRRHRAPRPRQVSACGDGIGRCVPRVSPPPG